MLNVQANDRSLTDEDIREEVETILWAGHETTASVGRLAAQKIFVCAHKQEFGCFRLWVSD